MEGKRQYGGGSVYQRADGAWIASVGIPGGQGTRRRKVFYAKTQAAVAAKLAAWLADNPLPERPAVIRTEAQQRGIDKRLADGRNARAIATHRPEEWAAKVASANGRCHYCKRVAGPLTKDHVTPISRGGSDGIDNVVPACADCNREKSSLTGEEFAEWAAATGFFARPVSMSAARTAWKRRSA